jgi:hypothetical protein
MPGSKATCSSSLVVYCSGSRTGASISHWMAPAFIGGDLFCLAVGAITTVLAAANDTMARQSDA